MEEYIQGKNEQGKKKIPWTNFMSGPRTPIPGKITSKPYSCAIKRDDKEITK